YRPELPSPADHPTGAESVDRSAFYTVTNPIASADSTSSTSYTSKLLCQGMFLLQSCSFSACTSANFHCLSARLSNRPKWNRLKNEAFLLLYNQLKVTLFFVSFI